MIIVLSAVSFRGSAPDAVKYQYRQFTSIESIIPGGAGRSRIIESTTDGQDISKDLINIYSLGGINFKNIASNDALVVSTLNQYSSDGWELYSVSTGVQSPNSNNSQGIYMSRYLFRKPV
ncbi:MAG: hypothetical protein H0W62_09745 [Chitinophagales bacterium]|nr:hypothetical protein [Chitinophagales bacterium]